MTADITDLKILLGRVAAGERLDEGDASRAFEAMISGNATPAQMGAFLMALRVRGETVAEITGAARVLRAKALKIVAPAGAIDTCGTGGDASGTFNVSTCASFVVAACGVPVAKHGNRALSSKSGAADVLTALGVEIDCDMSVVQRALDEVGICFLMAPRHHSAMRNVAGVRVELATRTIFNLLGPLANPAGARRQLMGVYARDWIAPLAEVLGRLGTEAAWVVHGSDGIDELTVTGPSHVAELKDGMVRVFEVDPSMADCAIANAADLKGGDAQTNAQALLAVLSGAHGAYRDIVILNAAAALVVAGKAGDLAEGASRARHAIDAGGARAKLDALVAVTRGTA
jgi:anthranilate phosphoribosyltransferase